MVAARESPGESAKLTLEGLLHWQSRLSDDCAQLLTDIETTESVCERWGGKDRLEALRALHQKKTADLQAVTEAVNGIRKSSEILSTMAAEPGKGPFVLVPRKTGHPVTGVAAPVLSDACPLLQGVPRRSEQHARDVASRRTQVCHPSALTGPCEQTLDLLVVAGVMLHAKSESERCFERRARRSKGGRRESGFF